MNDFQILTRSRSALLPIREGTFFEQGIAYELLEENSPLPRPVRRLGVSLSNLEDTHPYEGKQLTLSF
ncbi:hypothetical protein GCM10027275_43430 [Rhabdobacter roseus]|uniref:DNA polymerase Y-family little finger domain-containing protein n=1 Tax=Rhabdobacter roseus TaxID=1655419 RepID=A0A840U3A8_9BACT|nr:hypothetical protein [Rhabdobacter roseus]MBB5286600.1 hypothetical protein [Rhabdobacter roseus]